MFNKFLCKINWILNFNVKMIYRQKIQILILNRINSEKYNQLYLKTIKHIKIRVTHTKPILNTSNVKPNIHNNFLPLLTKMYLQNNF